MVESDSDALLGYDDSGQPSCEKKERGVIATSLQHVLLLTLLRVCYF